MDLYIPVRFCRMSLAGYGGRMVERLTPLDFKPRSREFDPPFRMGLHQTILRSYMDMQGNKIHNYQNEE